MTAKRWLIVALTFVCATSTNGQRHNKNSESALEDGCGPGLPYLPDCHVKIVAKTPTLKGKIDYLARIADSSQIEMNGIEFRLNLQRDAEAANAKDINGLWKQIDQITPPVPPAKTVSDVQKLRQDIEDLGNQFREFRDVACPAIQSARLDPNTRMRLDRVCDSR
jgi:hypothetical protein